jgi:hypothetical protein
VRSQPGKLHTLIEEDIVARDSLKSEDRLSSGIVGGREKLSEACGRGLFKRLFSFKLVFGPPPGFNNLLFAHFSPNDADHT